MTAVVDAVELEPLKMAALREHRSQVALDGPFFEMAEVIGPEAFGLRVLPPGQGQPPGPHRDAHGWETDLFDGLD